MDYRKLAAELREKSLDVYADEADAIADAENAWAITDEDNPALAAELENRQGRLWRAIDPVYDYMADEVNRRIPPRSLDEDND